MSYLRTNYRLGGGEVDLLALGPVIKQGSQAQGSGYPAPFGGFIVVSLITTVLDSQASTTAGATGYACISMVSVLASAWGCDNPMLNSGYQIWPALLNILGASTDDGSQYGDFGGRYIAFRDVANSGSILRLRFDQLSTEALEASASVCIASVPRLCSDGTAIKLLFTGFVTSGPGAGW